VVSQVGVGLKKSALVLRASHRTAPAAAVARARTRDSSSIIEPHLGPAFWRAPRLGGSPAETPLPSGDRRRSRPSG